MECRCSEDCRRRMQRWNWKQDGEAVSAVELYAEDVPGKIYTCDTKQNNYCQNLEVEGLNICLS